MFFDYQKVKNVKIQVEISIMSDISYFSDGMDNSRDIYGYGGTTSSEILL